MLSRCANSQCSKRFLRLGEGRLFQVETDNDPTTQTSPSLRHQTKRVERYWLCDECSKVWTLAHDQKRGIVLLPLPQPVLGPSLAPEEERPHH